uniref:Arb2 domain-containing protein n=1 Tax=Petromyzon marinus TaxID=7757 RepID=S4RUA0_PETMA
QENENPEKHMNYVWEHFVDKSVAKQIFIVAHSYGGVAVVNLMVRPESNMRNELSAVAFTDSVHGFYGGNRRVLNWFKKNSVNWVSSSEELNTRIIGYRDEDCMLLSAGTMQHEMTSYSAYESVFKYFDDKLENPNYQPGMHERDVQLEVMEA